MQYGIGEFSKRTGIGIHALRYYEKEKLIVPSRNESNRRCYTEDDIRRIDFIKRLKEIGVSIKEIQEYAALRDAGDATIQKRMELLGAFQAALGEKMAALWQHDRKLSEKIAIYQAMLQKQAGRGDKERE